MIKSLVTVGATIKTSPLARRFLGGAAWSIIGAVGSSGITLIMWMLVARILGKETYGQFIVVQSTLGMVGVFAGFGIGMAATRYAAELRASDPTRLGHILILGERSIVVFGVLASVGLAASASSLAEKVLNAPVLAAPLSIAAVIVFFSALDGYQKSVLIGLESMRAFATGSIAAVCMGFPIILVGASKFGLFGAVIGLSVASLIQAGVSRCQMTRELKKLGVIRHAIGSAGEWQVLWRFALPAFLSGALVGPVHWVAQAILANTPRGYAELAVLGIAMQWFNLILFVPGSAGRAVLPIVTDYVTKGDPISSRKIIRYAMLANALVAVPLATMVCFLSPYIMGMYGQGYDSDSHALVLAVTTAALAAIQAPIGNLLVAKARMWLGSTMNLGWAFVYLGLTLVLAQYGAIGVLLALAAGYICHTAWQGYFAVNALRQPHAERRAA